MKENDRFTLALSKDEFKAVMKMREDEKKPKKKNSLLTLNWIPKAVDYYIEQYNGMTVMMKDFLNEGREVYKIDFDADALKEELKQHHPYGAVMKEGTVMFFITSSPEGFRIKKTEDICMFQFWEFYNPFIPRGIFRKLNYEVPINEMPKHEMVFTDEVCLITEAEYESFFDMQKECSEINDRKWKFEMKYNNMIDEICDRNWERRSKLNND